MFRCLFTLLAGATVSNAYWLMAMQNTLTTQRLDPIVDPGTVSSHVHQVFGGSRFGYHTTTSAELRKSKCTTAPIPQDKSAYWAPTLWFEWNNGSFTSIEGAPVMYYLFDNPAGNTTEFPENFRMISGSPLARTYDPSSHSQQAITFKCLDFSGAATNYNELPPVNCPSGIRAQVNFQSCWDGKNPDSPDHQSHVAYKSGGPDTGSCLDPKFPVTLPRIFMEMYLPTQQFDSVRHLAKNPNQPFVYSMGDPTGYGYHADYMFGWEKGVLQKAIEGCHCNDFGDPHCCAAAGIFDFEEAGANNCYITNTVDEQATGTLPKLPGINPVQPAGKTASRFIDKVVPPFLNPVHVYGKGVHGIPSTSVAAGTIAVPATTMAAVPPAATPPSKNDLPPVSGSGSGKCGNHSSQRARRWMARSRRLTNLRH